MTSPAAGIEALLAAAAAASHNGEIPIDPLLSGLPAPSRDLSSALTSLLQNPIFVNSLLASLPNSGAPSRSALYARLLSDPVGTDSGLSAHIQQTRSGRISRPPASNQGGYSFLQSFANQIEPALRANDVKQALSGSTKQAVSEDQAYQTAVSAHHSAEATPIGAADIAGGDIGSADWWNASTLPGDVYGSAGRKVSETDWSDGEITGVQGGRGKRARTLDEGKRHSDSLPPLDRSGGPMSKEEAKDRRRARNRIAAVHSRKKKREWIDGLDAKYNEKTEECERLQQRVRRLEAEIDQLRGVIVVGGLQLPQSITELPPAPTLTSGNAYLDFNLNTDTNLSSLADPTGITLADMTVPASEELPDFDNIFRFEDMDGENDADFQPPSPRADDSSDSESEDGAEDRRPNEDNPTVATTAATSPGNDDDFEDEDVEDENLFLPIEDVPVPPPPKVENMTDDAMRSLGVKNKDELMDIIAKMLNAGQQGMTPEVMEKMKGLLTLMNQGGWNAGP